MTKLSEKRAKRNWTTRNPPWLDTSLVVDAVVVKGRASVGVGETPTDILSDWLDSLGTYDVNSVEDDEIIRVRIDMMMGGAGKF